MTAKGLFKILTPIMGMIGRKNLRDTAKALQDYLEGRKQSAIPRPLLPRRPYASWAEEGNPRLQNSLHSLGARPFTGSTRWVASPLRSGCLIRTNFSPILIYMYAACARFSAKENLRLLKTTLDRVPPLCSIRGRRRIAPFSTRMRFWRDTPERVSRRGGESRYFQYAQNFGEAQLKLTPKDPDITAALQVLEKLSK